MRVSSLAVIALSLIPSAWAQTPEGANTDWRQFAHHGKMIAINPDPTPAPTRVYQITVSENGLPLSRLAVNRDGILSDAWKTDLDGDGNFEIVVATGQLGGGSEGGVDIHEWNDFRFESNKPPQVIVAERERYRGHDQYRIVDGALTRSFPRFEPHDGSDVPSGEMATYKYDFRLGQWQPLPQ